MKSKLKVEFWIGLGGGARKEGGGREISGKGWIEMIGGAEEILHKKSGLAEREREAGKKYFKR